MSTVIYKIRNDLAVLNSDEERMQYINHVGGELQKIASIIQGKNQFSFVEVIEEEKEDVPVCNED